MSKIYVGMSGGVDSSLSAALLIEAGHDVTGVYMKNWTQDLPGMICPWADDLADAKRVAVQLGIPFKVYDFQSAYRHKVVEYMIKEYEAGRTPNPDIMCNQEVKFKLYLDAALDDGAEMIATGHYARVKDGHLLMAEDTNKDQTYFLYRVTKKALDRTFFPLGNFTKPEVRKMAETRGLVTAMKRDSQGICFVGSVGIKDFLGQFVKTVSGEVIEKESGAVVGHHDGAIYYTIGQRHGLGLGGGLPYYVTSKDMRKNEIYVSRNLNDESMWRHELRLSDLHWIDKAPENNTDLRVRLRHRGALLPAVYDNGVLKLEQPERSVAAGQSGVLYRDEVCLGGGIIA